MRTALSVYRALALWVLWVRRLLARGGGTSTLAEQRVASGQAWDEFCDTLKAAGATLVAPGAPQDPLNQAEGYRYLSRLLRAGLENFIECADPEGAPQLCAIANGSRAARICIGSDNPDNLYENATLDGSLEYVVTGTRGTVGYLGFGTQSGQYGGKGGLRTVDYLEAEQLAMFIVRQTFGIRASEQPARLSIARRHGAGEPSSRGGGGGGPTPLSAAKLDEGLQATAAGGDPNIRYYHSYWRLPPGFVLRVTARPPACRCWNFQLNNHWMESLDYRHHPVHTNSTLARPDASDPSLYTLLVSHADPNADGTFRGNFISTVGHQQGTMCFRWVGVAPHADGDALPHPKADLIPLDQLMRGGV
ncbi:hypothetical protein EMIHUDRAFT_234108 [Emiliania huxleyi CCMP1516]|uniref:Uncharacterized protein n=2 Tax=Emiliania huxleyi TaxID=2903 RepID=A0A0D3K077_EMIH1|nr:hypothetical protein EMIHUDRAFT_234108 [Emiliania huxleyi CCMP1516]EOD29162.1 hypothetical protein EMIHUDRAFT_234108 [Emiliania huxleyi CCMP1516]|eukprot:XP_005781591.1 hypothetical protein EMIHUDRAFT_234108 [Emiliania huxleyi CCMP1516]